MTRGRLATLAAVLASVGVLLSSGLAGAKPDKAKARQHFEQAEAFMNTGVYDEAIKEYKQAYRYAPTAHGFLFNIGLAYEKWGNTGEALSHYKRYLKKAPSGKKVAEARARKVAIERKLEKARKDAEARNAAAAAEKEWLRLEAERKAAQDAKQRPIGTDVKDPGNVGAGPGDGSNGTGNGTGTGADLSQRRPDDTVGQGRSLGKWAMIGIGAGLIAGGIVLDLAPESASNGSLDIMDIIPPGLYAAGATLMIVGVF